jgi:hypothetical protein
MLPALYAIQNNYPQFKNSETNLLWAITSEFHCSASVLNLYLAFRADMFVRPDTIILPMYEYLKLMSFHN